MTFTMAEDAVRIEAGDHGPVPGGPLSGLVARAVQHRNLLLYAAIGGTASAIDVGLFSLLYVVFGWAALASHAVAVPVSVVYSFGMNARFNFRTSDQIMARLASFAVIAFIGFLVGALVIWVIEGLLGVSGVIAKFVSLPVVFTVQYVMNSRVTFRENLLKASGIATDRNGDAVEAGV